MKLNYRDKVILGIVLAIAIFLCGFFLLIKPKNQTIKDDQKKLDSLEVTEKDYKQKIDQIEPLKETINGVVADTGKITENFVPIKDIENTVLLDRYMQHFANENDIKITNLAVGDMTEDSMSYYYISAPSEIGSGLRSIADINGEYLKSYENTIKEETQLSERETGTVLKTQYGITAKGTKENLWKLLDALEAEKKTILVDSVSYTKVKKEDNSAANAQPAEGEAATPSGTTSDEEDETINPEDEVEINMVISLYSVYDLPQVKVDDIN